MKSSSADTHTEAHMIYVKDEFALITQLSSVLVVKRGV